MRIGKDHQLQCILQGACSTAQSDMMCRHEDHEHWACIVLQVFSTLQLANIVVHCYPYLPSMERLLETVAVTREGPAADSSTNLQGENEQAAEWTAFSEYVALLAVNVHHEYVPLLPFLTK